MEASSLSISNLPEVSPPPANPVETASVVPAVATPPDPTSIPIEPPHGSPRPPLGQLMPDVAAAEDPNYQLQSPTKDNLDNTPPPSTPSPIHVPAGPGQTESFSEHEQPALSEQGHTAAPTNGATEHAYGQELLPTSSELDMGYAQQDDAMFGDEPFKTEADGDAIMHGEHHEQEEASHDVIDDLNGVLEDPNHALYQQHQSPSDFATASQQYTEHDSLDGPPPAKRQKVDSPGSNGMAEDSPGAGLSLESPVAPTAPWARPLTHPQSKFAMSVIRSLKKNKDAVPFLNPVDPIALSIPQYSTIVTNPMDLSTIEKKLGGAKPDAGQYQRYANVEEFVADFKLVVQNCTTFNGPEHPVTHMVKRVEEAFDKLMKNMPSADDVKPPVMKPAGVKKGALVRRPSTAGGSFPRRDDSYIAARPKREVPPPRDQRDYQEAPRRAPVKKRFPKRDDGTIEQLKFCTKLIQELYRPKYSSIASPFYDPVDYVKLELPHYPKVIKKPMDMSTILHKLTVGEYHDARAFHTDFKLMIKNCFTFNPAGTPVHQAGVALNEVFDERWASLPPLYGESDDDDQDVEESDNDHSIVDAVLVMEAQIQSLHNALASLKKTKPKKEKIKKPAPAIPRPPKPSNGKVGGSGMFKKKKKSGHDEEDNLTFEQKKQLSESIQTLDGSRLEKVLEIIDEVYPEIRETSEEIELDIDALPPHVLIRLYNFVIRPYKPRVGRPPGGSGSSKLMGTNQVAGTKRKSMNEDEETAKIRQLEETLQRLKNGSATADDMEQARLQMNSGGAGGDDSGSESGSSDSSGSDSE